MSFWFTYIYIYSNTSLITAQGRAEPCLLPLSQHTETHSATYTATHSASHTATHTATHAATHTATQTGTHTAIHIATQTAARIFFFNDDNKTQQNRVTLTQ